MPEINFYHLEREPADAVLARILVRLSKSGERTSVHLSKPDTLQSLSQKLWAFEDASFIAHGLDGDPSPEHQPIWLTSQDETHNAAALRFFAEGKWPEEFSGISKVGVLFDGTDSAAVEEARARWKRYKAEGHTIRYWKQSEQGQWQDQAAKQ